MVRREQTSVRDGRAPSVCRAPAVCRAPPRLRAAGRRLVRPPAGRVLGRTARRVSPTVPDQLRRLV